MNTDQKLRVVIVDDERSARSTLRHILAAYCPEVEVVGEASSAKEGIDVIEKLSPDLVFLDIRMPYISGFEMLKNIQNRNFQVVFTTAYEEYAIQAFRFSAFDYLLKPIDIVQIREVTDRAIQFQKSGNYHRERLAVFLENESSQRNQKIVLVSQQGFKVVEVADIVRCQADRNYTQLYFKKGSFYLATKTLKQFQNMLESHGFFRIHQSHLINLQEVEEFQKLGRGGTVRLKDGTELEVARRKRTDFLAIMQGATE